MANRHPTRAQIRVAFGRTVRSLRLRAGVSQENLALQSGLDRGYMGALERGVHVPTLDTVLKLLPYLGVTWAEFGEALERALRKH